MGTEKHRAMVLHKLQKTFISAFQLGLGISKDKIVSELCMEYGVTRRKALEYIKVLRDSGFIVEDALGLWFSDKYISHEEIDKAGPSSQDFPVDIGKPTEDSPVSA